MTKSFSRWFADKFKGGFIIELPLAGKHATCILSYALCIRLICVNFTGACKIVENLEMGYHGKPSFLVNPRYTRDFESSFAAVRVQPS